MLRRCLPAALASVLCWAALATAAQAKAVNYVVQVGDWTHSTSLTLDGDQITSFRAQVAASSCVSGTTDDSANSWTFTATSPTALQDGNFSFSGSAANPYYGSSGLPDTASVTVTGHVTPDHGQITGTITLSDAYDMFLQDCSGTEHFFAIPKRHVPQHGPGLSHGQYQGQFITFNDRNGAITNLRLQANFMCGESTDDAEVSGSTYGDSVIRTSRSGRWSMRAYVLDAYGSIVDLDVSGRVDGRRAWGHFRVSEPAGLLGMDRDACHGNAAWSAARPTPPAPPGPTAFFTWEAIRAAAGAGYRYYFYASDLSCSHGANAVEITIADRTTTLDCSSRGGWASGPLSPGQGYETKSVAIELRGHHIVKRGAPVAQPVQMPGADDHWQPIGHFPTPPPA